MSDTGKRIELDWGYVLFGTNELTIVSTVDDPPKLRLASKTGSFGGISFNKLRDTGIQEEHVLIQGGLNEDTSRGGEIKVHLHNGQSGNDEDMVPVFRMTAQGAEFKVPLTAPNLPVQPAMLIRAELTDQEARYKCIMQGDGNLVIYRVDREPWVALWQSGTVQP